MSERQAMLDLGTRIKHLRTARGMTQKELAGRVSLERTSITNIELGNQQVSVAKLQAIGQALGYRVQIQFEPLYASGNQRDEWR
jgi:transcriptional regulator with XRE-family HTH domain